MPHEGVTRQGGVLQLHLAAVTEGDADLIGMGLGNQLIR
jgi:hypothetical protein